MHIVYNCLYYTTHKNDILYMYTHTRISITLRNDCHSKIIFVFIIINQNT